MPFVSRIEACVPDKVLLSARHFKILALYKPPVGIVAVLVVSRLVLSGRLFRWRATRGTSNIGMLLDPAVARLWRKQKNNRHSSSSSSSSTTMTGLARDDYTTLEGGMDAARCELILSATDLSFRPCAAPSWFRSLRKGLLEVEAADGTNNSKLDFVEKLSSILDKKPVGTVSSMDFPLHSTGQSIPGFVTDFHGENESGQIEDAARTLVESRAVDAMLRLCRNHSLQRLQRLRRLRFLYELRIRWRKGLPPCLGLSTPKRMRRLRRQLADLKLDLHLEFVRLGDLMAMLGTRPPNMSDNDIANCRLQLRRTKQLIRQLTSVDDLVIDSQEAWRAVYDEDLFEWTNDTRAWIRRAKQHLYKTMSERDDDPTLSTYSSCREVLIRWRDDRDEPGVWAAAASCLRQYTTDQDQAITSTTRSESVGTTVLRFTNAVDVCGIPSSLASVGLAAGAHRLLTPTWNRVVSTLNQGLPWAAERFRRQVLLPFGRVVAAYSRNNKPLSPLMGLLDADNEEESLDNMLKNLGFGKGSGEDRNEALRSATRSYEKLINRGIVTNLVRGRLFRLTLMQVVQLKAGLLRALEEIDTLVQATQLNVRIIAAIPAVLLVMVTTRFLVRAVVTYQVRDIRPLRSVCEGMGGYLYEMEKLLVSAQKNAHPERSQQNGFDLGAAPLHGRTIPLELSPADFGRFVLHAHEYLVLLDHCSSLLQARSSAFIRTSLRQLLEQPVRQLTRDAQISLLRLIREKHAELVASI